MYCTEYRTPTGRAVVNYNVGRFDRDKYNLRASKSSVNVRNKSVVQNSEDEKNRRRDILNTKQETVTYTATFG